MRLFSQYDDHERNYKPVNDAFFTHFELGYLTSYNILLGVNTLVPLVRVELHSLGLGVSVSPLIALISVKRLLLLLLLLLLFCLLLSLLLLDITAIMVNHEVWVLVVRVGVSMGDKRVVGAWGRGTQQADVRLC